MNYQGTSEEIIHLRSRYMLASSRSDQQKGIWKVGEDHITDIKNLLGSEGRKYGDDDYTLTHIEEFERELHPGVEFPLVLKEILIKLGRPADR